MYFPSTIHELVIHDPLLSALVTATIIAFAIVVSIGVSGLLKYLIDKVFPLEETPWDAPVESIEPKCKKKCAKTCKKHIGQ
jgi:hypothetical protein